MSNRLYAIWVAGKKIKKGRNINKVNSSMKRRSVISVLRKEIRKLVIRHPFLKIKFRNMQKKDIDRDCVCVCARNGKSQE